ncbi:MAG: AAA family ATPase [Patescibacteria group bacterium]
MIISLTGLPGAGKSTVKNLLAHTLNLKSYSMGDIRGKMAIERGMTIDEFNALGMNESFTDNDVDHYQEQLGKTEDNFIVDGWMSWHFIPQSFKVFLTIEPRTSAERIFAARQNEKGRDDEPLYQSVEETQHVLDGRVRQNRERYQKWYGVDYLDLAHYDLIVDTTNLTPIEVAERILSAARASA